MSGLNEWKKKASLNAATAPQKRDRAIRGQLAAAAGAQWAQNRDPLYHITEDFQKTFDLMGRRRAERYGIIQETRGLGNIAPGITNSAGQKSGEGREGPEAAQNAGEGERLSRAAEMDRMVEPAGDPGNRMFLSRFSEIAFQRGTMAAAVLRGTGKMMLFSCLKRTVGQSQPRNLRQRMLFEGASVRRNVAGRTPDQAVFNRGAIDGAVGLVVDALQDARQTVESLSELAGGKNVLKPGSGAETLQKMYPFLTDERDRALLADYKAQLKTAGDPGDQALLEHAVIKTQALITRKKYMKERFITALRQVTDSATSALMEFSQPGFSDEMFDLLRAAMPPEPPEEGGNGSGEEPEEEKAPQ